MNVIFGTGRAKFPVYRGNVSPWTIEVIKKRPGPLSKLNTGMAALRAGLPIKVNRILQSI